VTRDVVADRRRFGHAPPSAVPEYEYLAVRARTENFPVASVILPRAARRHLLAIYGFARLADDLGDDAPGDRLALLDWLESELDHAYDGVPHHPAMRRLSVTVRALELPREPFANLIEANRRDQCVTRHETYRDLLDSCELSANPIGRLVLAVFGIDTPERTVRSDAICTGLQIIEHCQDVGEDYRRGRVYIPQEDLERYGCDDGDLATEFPSAALQRVLAFELQRAVTLLDAGSALIDSLSGRLRLAVAGFVAGGRSAADAVRRAHYDVLRRSPRAGRFLFLRHFLRAAL
jgi:squalene synthase HpnC